jgi:glycosyltransferase involved in cell wall biosynthesis
MPNDKLQGLLDEVSPVKTRGEKTRRELTSIILVGAQPPPVNGMAIVNASIAKRLTERSCNLVIADVGPGGTDRNFSYHVRRIKRNLWALIEIMRQTRSVMRTVYLSVDSGWGVLYTLAHAVVARLTGSTLVLHHHSALYLRKRSPTFAMLASLAGSRAVHVLASQDMIERFRALYPVASRFLQVHNAAFVPPINLSEAEIQRPLTLGLLSNLSREKGLNAALETIIALVETGISCRLILGGPLVDVASTEAVNDARRRCGRVLEVRGPVYGMEKERFYQDIDVFLFPSTWKHETQSLVVPEAMAHGIPVLAYAHANVSDLLGDGCFGIPLTQDFSSAALTTLKLWAQAPEERRAAGMRARARFEIMHQQANAQIETLLDMIVNPRGAESDSSRTTN